MKGKGRAILILVVVILLPLLIYAFLRLFSTAHYKPLAILGEREPQENSNGTVDTLYHSVYKWLDQYEFQTQTGETFNSDSLKGKIFIANVFFTSCEGICPKLSAGMARLHYHFQKDPRIRFLSITVDPETDSVSTIFEYAERYGAEHNRWYFITGKKKELYDVANKAFFFKALEGPGGEMGFIHDDAMMLVDPEGRLRTGFDRNGNFVHYDGTKAVDVELLKEEIRALKNEYPLKVK